MPSPNPSDDLQSFGQNDYPMGLPTVEIVTTLTLGERIDGKKWTQGDMTLVDLKQGVDSRIIAIGGGQNIQQQLRELGVFPGDTVRVVRRAGFGGPLLVECRGIQIAIGRAIAQKVRVE